MANMFSSLSANSRSKKMMIVIAATAALLVVALLSLAIVSIVSGVRAKNPDEEITPAPSNGIPAGFVTTTFTENQLYNGNLILTNDTYIFQGTAPDVSLKANRPTNTNPANPADPDPLYSIFEYPLVTQETNDACHAMMQAFHEQNASACEDLIVDIPNDEIYTNGMTIRLRYYPDYNNHPDQIASIAGVDTYDWIFTNAYKYGFVQMYEAPTAETTSGESASTPESQEHIFRYVGTVHAQLMKDKKVATFEAYLTYLRQNTSASKTASTTVDKKSYRVYYLAKDAKQIIPEKYKNTCVISGDNMTGYIVTYCTTATK